MTAVQMEPPEFTSRELHPVIFHASVDLQPFTDCRGHIQARIPQVLALTAGPRLALSFSDRIFKNARIACL